jgi:hypothetical protein
VDWQTAVAILWVLAAAAYVARATWRTWHPKAAACGGGCCGKAAPQTSAETFVAADEVRVRRR